MVWFSFCLDAATGGFEVNGERQLMGSTLVLVTVSQVANGHPQGMPLPIHMRHDPTGLETVVVRIPNLFPDELNE